MSKQKVSVIAVHHNPHLDEWAAIKVLREYGEDHFTGVSKAKIVVWGKTELSHLPPRVTVYNETLLVGMGGGAFDDHVCSPRKECATTLVVKHLGLDKDPAIRAFANSVFQADSQINGPAHALAEEIKRLNRYWVGSLDLEKMYAAIEPFLTAHVGYHKERIDAKKRFSFCYKKHVNGFLVVAASELDNCQFQHIARGGGADIIVQRNSHGLTQIFGHESLDMPGLWAKVRKSEIVKSNLRFERFLNDVYLSRSGTLPEVPHWHGEGNNLLNGSESFPDVLPSNIPFDHLVRIVEKHIAGLVKENRQVSEAA